MRPSFEPRCSRVGFSEKQHCFSDPFSIWLGDHVNGGLCPVKVESSVSTLISRRAPRCALLRYRIYHIVCNELYWRNEIGKWFWLRSCMLRSEVLICKFGEQFCRVKPIDSNCWTAFWLYRTELYALINPFLYNNNGLIYSSILRGYNSRK